MGGGARQNHGSLPDLQGFKVADVIPPPPTTIGRAWSPGGQRKERYWLPRREGAGRDPMSAWLTSANPGDLKLAPTRSGRRVKEWTSASAHLAFVFGAIRRACGGDLADQLLQRAGDRLSRADLQPGPSEPSASAVASRGADHVRQYPPAPPQSLPAKAVITPPEKGESQDLRGWPASWDASRI